MRIESSVIQPPLQSGFPLRPFPACSEAAAPRIDQASDGNPRLDGIEQKHPDQFVRDRSGLVKGVKLSVNDL